MAAELVCALALQEIAKTYRTGLMGRVEALRDVSLRVRGGEVVALLGHNGAGKTTLMKVALGLLRPSRGTGEVLGRPLGDLAARRGIGFQPEQPYLYPFLTVRETLVFLGQLSGLRGVDLGRRIEALTADCRLERVLAVQVRQLSRGWLQRVAFAAALLGDPQLLLLDEPLGGLDPEARISLKERIARLRTEGRAVLINSHILPDVEELADRVALLRHGQLVACGPLGELLQSDAGGFEIEVAGSLQPPDAQRCQALWTRPAQGRALWWIPGIERAELQHLLRTWIDAGLEIVSVIPHREGLETFFSRVAGRDAA